MKDESTSESVQRLRERRQFVKSAIRGAGIAIALPVVLSVVSASDLQAQATEPGGNGNRN